MDEPSLLLAKEEHRPKTYAENWPVAQGLASNAACITPMAVISHSNKGARSVRISIGGSHTLEIVRKLKSLISSFFACLRANPGQVVQKIFRIQIYLTRE